MKFLNYYPNKGINFYCDDFSLDYLSDYYLNFCFEKQTNKNRKNINNIRPGVSKNIKKNSIKRDKNNNLLFQFISLNTKKGKKTLILKNISIMLESLFFSFSNFCVEFNNYSNYNSLFYIFNKNIYYFNPNNIFFLITSGLESIFEIKTKKNNKKLKLKEKYSHEIAYIPRERRLKYILRSLSFYKENFKNYNLWERLFWSFFNILLNKEKSFLSARREYIYIKSVKFFKKKNNPLK